MDNSEADGVMIIIVLVLIGLFIWFFKSVVIGV
jgi:hypothetical protein